MKKSYIVLLTTDEIFKQINITADYYEMCGDRIIFFEKRKNEEDRMKKIEVLNLPINISTIIDPINLLSLI
jgi:hypothetical protein